MTRGYRLGLKEFPAKLSYSLVPQVTSGKFFARSEHCKEIPGYVSHAQRSLDLRPPSPFCYRMREIGVNLLQCKCSYFCNLMNPCLAHSAKKCHMVCDVFIISVVHTLPGHYGTTLGPATFTEISQWFEYETSNTHFSLIRGTSLMAGGESKANIIRTT